MKTTKLILLALFACSCFAGEPSTPPTAEERAKQVILPELKLHNALAVDVIDILHSTTISCCPEIAPEINFILDVHDPDIFGSNATHRISLKLHNISLHEALNYIAQALGLSVRYDKNAVVLSDKE